MLLDRARFSPGEIDGKTGDSFKKALAAFAAANALKSSGELSEEIWRRLDATSQAPAVRDHTISNEDVRGPFVPDPSCLYDAATQRFFVVVLTLETHPNGSFTLVNHLDLAVSQTSNPAGSWNIYRVDVTNDGSNIGGRNWPSGSCAMDWAVATAAAITIMINRAALFGRRIFISLLLKIEDTFVFQQFRVSVHTPV